VSSTLALHSDSAEAVRESQSAYKDQNPSPVLIINLKGSKRQRTLMAVSSGVTDMGGGTQAADEHGIERGRKHESDTDKNSDDQATKVRLSF